MADETEHQYVDNAPICDVRVYPQLFKTKRVDDEGHDEYIATEVRIRLAAHPSRKNRRGEYVSHPDLMVVSVENQDREDLVEITMHVNDQRHMMETLVYWHAGVGGLSVLQKFTAENPMDLDSETEDRQPDDD